MDAAALETVEEFSAAAQEAPAHTLRELEELRRAAASSLVVPGRPGIGGPRGPGGLPGGGRIRMP